MKAGASDEAQVDAVGGGGYRDDAVRRALVRSKTDDKEVVVVIGKLGRRGEALSQLLARGTDDCLMRWRELLDEAS